MDEHRPQTRKQKLLRRRRQIDAQLMDLDAGERTKRRRRSDHKKYTIGGHILALLEFYPEDHLSRAIHADMERHLKGEYHRDLLGLSPLPGDKNTVVRSTGRGRITAGKDAEAQSALRTAVLHAFAAGGESEYA